MSVLSLTSAAPASPTTGLLDDFNRGSENPVSQWGNWAPVSIEGGTPLLVSNDALVNGNAGSAFRVVENAGDSEAHYTVAIPPSSLNAQYLYVALEDAGTPGFDGCALVLGADGGGALSLRLRRYDDGVATELVDPPVGVSVAPGDKILLRKSGSSLEGWVHSAGAWTPRISAGGCSYSGGKIGVRIFGSLGNNGGSMDNFGGTGSTTPPPPPPPVPANGVLDDFNRPPENPVSQFGNWAPAGVAGGTALRLLNQRLEPSNSNTAYRQDDVSGDMEAYHSIAAFPASGNGQRLYIALKDAGTPAYDGYSLALERISSGFRLRLQRFTDGAATDLGLTGIIAVADGDRMLLRRLGTTIEGWYRFAGEWTLRLSSINQTQHAGAGKIGTGFFGGGAPGVIDDFGGGAIGAPPPPSSGAPPPEQTFGTDENGMGMHGGCGCGLFADPVSSRTGAFTTSVDDLDLPGTGVSFAWSRSYTSADTTVGRLGPGWTDSYSASLAVQPNGDVRLHGEDGQQLYYTKQGDGSFVGAPGSLSTLSAVTGGYELLRTDQVVYRFDTQGRLLAMTDRNDQGVTLGYDGSGRLATVTDAANRQATISYNAQDLVSQVSTQDGRSVGFGYTAGRLASVTDVRGKTWTYTYDAGGRLATIVDPLSHTQVTNVSGADGRVQSQTDALNKVTTFAWNAGTETATATDPNQKVWTHDYEDGVLVEEVDPLANDTDLVLDGDLNTTSVTGPTDETTQMTYDAAGNLLTATAPPSLGSVQKTFVYNARNDAELVTDARGKVTDYAYNPTTGNVVSVTQDGVGVGSYTYDAAGRVETFTDGNEKTWTYAYFPATGYLQSSTDPLGNKTTYTYDGAGRVATRVDPKGNVQGCNCAADFTWTYTYNPAGQQLTEQNPLGHTTTNVYDDVGRLVSTSDPLNRVTSYTYDDANRVLTESAPDPDGGGPVTAPVTTSTYDNVGNKLTETDPRGNATTFAYDGSNRLVSTTGTDPDGAGPLSAPVSTNTYDPNGNLASTVEPRGNVSGANPDEYRTTFTYDAAGRMLTETRPDPDGGGPQTAPVTTNVYDPVGNLQSVRDGNNHTTAYTYDAGGRILTVTGPDLGVTTYTYDDAGNPLTRRDDNNHVTTSAYDDAGRLSSESSPDPDGPGPQGPAVTSYTYDANGNRLTLTDPNGNATPAGGDGVTTYGYDRANRQTSITYSDSTPDVTFTYDAAGNRLTMADGSGTETRTYDNLDRVSTVTRGSNAFSYVYDSASNVTRRTYPGNTIANYTYDPLNRLATVVSGSQTTSYAYDAASNPTQTRLPSGNGYVETRVYDRAGRLTEVRNQKGATVLSHFVSTLDPVGNPTQIVRTGGLAETQTYTYDASDRITGFCLYAGTCPGGATPFILWTYDRVGNRLTEQRPTGTTSYSYDARDRLLSAGSTSFAYDQNGNQTQQGTRTFTYDLATSLRTTTQGSTTTTYSYDGDGKRLQASTGTSNSSKTNFLWDVSFGLPQLARENNGSGSLQRRYVYGERRISLTNSSNTTYYHYDPLGSAANMTSSSGSTRWTYTYEPFGTLRTETPSGSAPTNFMKFAGEYLDPTALYHLRARQYDSASGRFLRPDPVDTAVGSFVVSAYGYSANRPTILVDPSGETFRPAHSSRRFARFATSLTDRPLVQNMCAAEVCGGLSARRVYPIPRRFNSSVGLKAPHDTGDLPGYPAYDFFADEGTPVVAVERGEIREFGSSAEDVDGDALYLLGDSGIDYWYGHIRRSVSKGQRVRLGQVIGRIARHLRSDHLHLGANANTDGRIIGPQRAGTNDPRDPDHKRGRAIMNEISRAPRVR